MMGVQTNTNSAFMISTKNIDDFRLWLHSEERSKGTIEKYTRDIERLSNWLGEKELTKENLTNWKESLLEKGYKPVTINSMLAVVNTYCRFIGLSIKLKFLRVQHKLFCDENRELKRSEYENLIRTAEKKGDDRLALLIQTIGATGIRVSEVKYITVEAIKGKRTQISLKGKIRVILIPHKLCRKLLSFAKKQKIVSGEIFITKNGKSLDRKLIWAMMKSLCESAGIQKNKVFPHNLRHLFARIYYKTYKDVTKLADILGHSSIETTRIYLLSTGIEHAKQLETLNLII